MLGLFIVAPTMGWIYDTGILTTGQGSPFPHDAHMAYFISFFSFPAWSLSALRLQGRKYSCPFLSARDKL